MHELWTIATDVPVAWMSCLLVCHVAMPCKPAEWFGVEIFRGPRNIVFNGAHSPTARGREREGISMRPSPCHFGHLLKF